MKAHDDILLYGGVNTLNNTWICIPFPKLVNAAFGFNSFWDHTLYVAGYYVYYNSPTHNIKIFETSCVGLNSGSFHLQGYLYR